MDGIFRLIDAWDRRQRLVITPQQMGVASLNDVDKCHIIAGIHRERPGLYVSFWGDSLVVSTPVLEFGELVVPFVPSSVTSKPSIVAVEYERVTYHARTDSTQMRQYLPHPDELRARDSATAKHLRAEQAREWVESRRQAIVQLIHQEFKKSKRPSFLISAWSLKLDLFPWRDRRDLDGDYVESFIGEIVLEYINNDPQWSASRESGNMIRVSPRDVPHTKTLMDVAREVD